MYSTCSLVGIYNNSLNFNSLHFDSFFFSLTLFPFSFLIQKYIFRVVFLSRLTFHTFVSFSTMSILVCLHFELTLSVFQSLHMCLSVCLPLCPCLSFLCLFVTWSPSVRISLSLSLPV